MKHQSAEEIFYNNIRSLVKNLIVENKNNSNEYFNNQTKFEFREDVKDRGQYILEEIERTKHLILDV